MADDHQLALTERPAADGSADGPLVVFVHGSLDRAGSFARVTRRLPELHTVAYDRRGYHRSGHLLPVHDSLDGHVEDLLSVVDPDGRQFGASTLTVPAVFGRGSNSLLHQRDAVAWLVDHVAGSELIEFAGAAHGAHLTQPDSFAGFVRHIAARAEISPEELEAAVKACGHPVPKGGTVLLCTGHHARTFPRKEYASDNCGVNVAATEWLAAQGVVHFGIDSMRPAPDGKVNSLVHKACFDLGITHIESLCNLEALLGQGPFTFIGLPMKWRDGTGSPIRAVAVFGM